MSFQTLRQIQVRFLLVLLATTGVKNSILGVQVVTDGAKPIRKEVQLRQDLPVYRDPSLFLPNLDLIDSDPLQGWDTLLDEPPLLTTLTGAVCLELLAKPAPFKNFHHLVKLYGIESTSKASVETESPLEPEKRSPLMIPVKLCDDTYSDTLGFVFESDLVRAETQSSDGSLPPSTLANPIPILSKR